MTLPQELTQLLNLDGFIFFIEGRKGKGKTNLALLLAEICFAYNYRKHIATNIKTESFYIEQITNYPDLEYWLKNRHGKKLFILDESGKHIARMAFMTTQNKSFMDLLQLIRHYDCGFIGIAPSSKRIDSGFLNTDILDAKIKKTALTIAKVTDYFNGCAYFIHDLPKTSIKHNDKDLADFEMSKPLPIETLEECCKFAYYYRLYNAIPKALNAMGLDPHQPEVGKRLLMKHLKHIEIHISQ